MVNGHELFARFFLLRSTRDFDYYIYLFILLLDGLIPPTSAA